MVIGRRSNSALTETRKVLIPVYWATLVYIECAPGWNLRSGAQAHNLSSGAQIRQKGSARALDTHIDIVCE